MVKLGIVTVGSEEVVKTIIFPKIITDFLAISKINFKQFNFKKWQNYIQNLETESNKNQNIYVILKAFGVAVDFWLESHLQSFAPTDNLPLLPHQYEFLMTLDRDQLYVLANNTHHSVIYQQKIA